MPRKPITPQEVEKRGKTVPDEVIEVFDELILENWNGRFAVIKQDLAALRIAKKLNITKEQVFIDNYLDIEHIYKLAGWNVEYDRPGYCETYPATFTFIKRKK